MLPQYGLPYNVPVSEGMHAIIMPLQSRRIELRIFHVPRGNAHYAEDGTVIITPWLELAPLNWMPCPDGEWAGEPFATGTCENDKGPMKILQAMVDLGHRLGIVPTDVEDRSREISALKYHLEDMRKIAGVNKKDQ